MIKSFHNALATILASMGEILLDTGEFDKSLPYFEEAKKIMDKLLGPSHSHPLTLCILIKIAMNQRHLHNFPEALRLLEDAFEMHRELYDECGNYGNMEDLCFEMGMNLMEMSRLIEATKYYTKAFEIAKKNPLTEEKYSNVMKILSFRAMCSNNAGEIVGVLVYLI